MKGNIKTLHLSLVIALVLTIVISSNVFASTIDFDIALVKTSDTSYIIYPENLTDTFKYNITEENIEPTNYDVSSLDANATNEVVNTYVEAIISGSKVSKPLAVNDGKVVRGTNITYTITATNDGSLEKEIIITDLVPENTTFVSADDSKLPVDVEVETQNGATATRKMLSWTVTVPVNGSVSKQFLVLVDSNTTVDTITNTATVDGINTNTIEDKVYYEDIAVRFSKKTDTIIGKNIVLVLDVSLSMNEKALPAEVDTNAVCSSGPYTFMGFETNECDEGNYYDHYYDSKTRKWYHYKTKLQLAKSTLNTFLE